MVRLSVLFLTNQKLSQRGVRVSKLVRSSLNDFTKILRSHEHSRARRSLYVLCHNMLQ